jgi:maltokinase
MAEETLPPALADWMTRQRWYTTKGSTPQLRRIGGWELATPTGTIETHYVLDYQPRGTTLYQVPLSRRQLPLEGITPAWYDDDYVYDAPHDPEYARAIFVLLATESETGGARGHRQPGARIIAVSASAVLKGEQSNTSIICSVEGGAPVILKIFRALHSGDNPDVVLQSAISAAGSELVPKSIGYLSGQWPDSGQPSGIAHGHLAFAQDFLSGAEDGWRIAIRAASAGEDFSASARALGAATAQIHLTLAGAMPTRDTEAADIEQVLAGMRRRLDAALGEVPELEAHRAAIEAVLDRAGTAAWPRLQRIHGDYHLGQVLSVPAADSAAEPGWVLVDFEGEPLRAMAERSALDLTLRDVAGMIRSFDYVAGSVAHATIPATELTPADWALAARVAFLAGYAESSGRDFAEHHALLDAFELDKALYETVYEVRNRPDWLGIPVEAILRLVGS